MEKKTIIVAHLVIVIVIGSFIGLIIEQILSLEKRIESLESDKSNLQAQVTSLQTQLTSLQNDKSRLQAQVTSLLDLVKKLELPHNYTVGPVLTTLTGNSSTHLTGPLFHIPSGHVKIVVKLTSPWESYWFYVVLKQSGVKYGNSTIWASSFNNPGTYINYVYFLEEGDYYMEVGSYNFNWQIIVYSYG